MNKKHVSIKSYIITSLMILLGISHIAIFFASFFLVRDRLKSNMLVSVQNEMGAIIERLVKYGYEACQDDGRVSYLADETASRYGGRVMIVSRDYEIIKDTSRDQTGAYIISRNIMDVMTGELQDKVSMDNSVIRIIRPVRDEYGITGVVVVTASLMMIYSNLYKQFALIGAVILIVFALDILIIVRISKGTVNDLDNINEQMTHAVQGNLQERLSDQRFSETQHFAESFNEILSRLSSIDQTRSEFVSNVSHELKTPITSMKVLAESITENEGADVEDYKEFMSDIVEEIDRETKIINDLLTLVKTDSQGNDLNFEEADVNEMMETIIKTVSPLAARRSISLEYESFKEVMAEIDKVKLSLAISNLVENAVKYNIDSGWIKCSLNADNKFFYVKVADSGVGIPEDAKDKVFDKFYRVDKARSRDTGGTGLGLSITRSIINSHRGTIKLYSESGKGTTFTVRIPLRQDRSKIQTVAENTVIEEKADEKTANA